MQIATRLRGWLPRVPLLLAVVPALFPSPRVPGPDATHALPGTQLTVSCMTASTCVAAGLTGGRGDLVSLRAGVADHVALVGKVNEVNDVSCPNQSGCVGIALGEKGLVFITTNVDGAITSTKTAKVPFDNEITLLSCRSLSLCEVGGDDFFGTRERWVLGSWNGSQLSLHTVTVPDHPVGGAGMNALSCVGESCTAVGYTVSGLLHLGLSVTEEANKTFHAHTEASEALDGVSCVSSAVCYASASGVILRLVNGVATARTDVADANLTSIACRGTSCEAAGQTASMTSSSQVGLVVRVSSGVSATPITVVGSENLTAIAMVGAAYTAVGGAAGHSLDVTG